MTRSPGGTPLPRVSVVVCGYTLLRRQALIDAATEARRQLAEFGGAGEVLVVTDHNPALQRQLAADLAGIAPVVPNRRSQGLSGARNTAIEETDGEVVVFLDDDACPRPGWLAGLLRPYADPAVIAVGGVAHPVWPATGRPPQLPAPAAGPGEFDWVVGCSYAGQPARRAEVRNLMGCSMSLRRSVFAATGGFVEDLGRVGTVPLGCEETELCIRARRHWPTARILLEPAAEVDHCVSADRVAWRYLWSRCRAEGISKAVVAARMSAEAALATERAYLTRTLPRGLARLLRQAGRSPARSAAGIAAIAGGTAVTALGYLQGRWGLRGRSLPAPPVLTDAPATLDPRPEQAQVVIRGGRRHADTANRGDHLPTSRR